VLTLDRLGEETLNRIATLALSSQLDDARKLDVRVKTDPSLLAKGQLESLAIYGEGLIMEHDIRLQEMVIRLETIAVAPFKALTGNIVLTQPTDGKARIVIAQADLNRAFNSDVLGTQLRSLQVQIEGKPQTLNVNQVHCRLLAEGRVGLDADVRLSQSDETQRVSFTTTPRVSDDGRSVVLEKVEYAHGKELSPELTQALVAKAGKILHLSHFEMPGISLQMHHLEVTEGQLTLQAVAHVTQFPSV
jgi:hypothetical protein